MLSRACASATLASAWTPTPSGPRCRRRSIIRAARSGSTGSPVKFRSPAMPHMSEEIHFTREHEPAVPVENPLAKIGSRVRVHICDEGFHTGVLREPELPQTIFEGRRAEAGQADPLASFHPHASGESTQ